MAERIPTVGQVAPAGSTPAVRLDGISRRFGDVVAVDRVDLELRAGEVLVLLGPSGCGKTTVLRLIAGFERLDQGTIDIGGRRVMSRISSIPPERRRVGMVFQDFALFPHLSVRDNVGYGIRREPDRTIRIEELLDLVGLSGEADRMPAQLSGGMQQRVALARALAPRPAVVLLDEPFSNLDMSLRTQLRAEVREVLRRAGASAIFVTHDQDEALTIGDRLAVMRHGTIEQCDAPEVVYGEPTTPFVASFVGIANLVPAACREDAAVTRFGVARLVRRVGDGTEQRGRVVLRPEHFEVDEAPDGPTSPGAWRVVARRFTGSEILLELAAPDGHRIWTVGGPHVRRLRLGDAVSVALRHVETVGFPGDPNEEAARPVGPERNPVHDEVTAGSDRIGHTGRRVDEPLTRRAADETGC